ARARTQAYAGRGRTAADAFCHGQFCTFRRRDVRLMMERGRVLRPMEVAAVWSTYEENTTIDSGNCLDRRHPRGAWGRRGAAAVGSAEPRPAQSDWMDAAGHRRDHDDSDCRANRART